MPATIVLSGTITDAKLGTPVPDADVHIVGGPNFGKKAVTDKNGKYKITKLKPGRNLVEASLAYNPLEKDKTMNASATLDFALIKA
jgi:hypothetical protein